jgi:hypothetical protein
VPEQSYTQQQTSVNTNTNTNTNTNNNNNSPLYNPVATCGSGKVGNGLCNKINECCSTFGFCGTSDSHCENRAPVSGVGQQTQTQQTQQQNQQQQQQQNQQQNQILEPIIVGTCGGGTIGNAICPNVDECCSKYGFCGSSLEYCADKATTGGANAAAASNNAAVTGGGGGGVPVQQPQYYSGGEGGPTVVTPGNIQFGGGHPEPINNYQDPTSTTTTTTTTTNTAVVPHGTSKKIIGYYAGWQWYDRNKLADPANIDFRKLQRINYAFFQFDAAGELYGIDSWGDPQVLFGPYSSMMGGGVQKCSFDAPHTVNCNYHEHNTGLIYRAHQAGCEVYPSIGGWTLSDNFPTVSANPVAREKFAENCLKILKYYQFDGVSSVCLCGSCVVVYTFALVLF